MSTQLAVISLLLQLELIVYCNSQLNCPLENPKIIIHYYKTLTTVNITRERQQLIDVPITNCNDGSVFSNDCCVCSDNKYVTCSSLTDVIDFQSIQKAKSIFIGVLGMNVSIADVISFDFKGNIALASINQYNTASINCIGGAVSGLVFSNLLNVYIGDIVFNSCGQKDAGFSGAVQFQNSYDVVIENVIFKQSIGSAIAFNSTDMDIIEFTPNQQQQSIEVAELNVTNCQFNSNNIISSAATTYGGGIAVYINDPYLPVTITIADSVFYNNQATYGGSIALITNSDNSITTTVKLEVTNAMFSENFASKDGGAYYELGLVESTFTKCTFHNNSALHFGGVATIIGLNVNLKTNFDYDITQSFQDTEFSYNTANSYAIMYVSLPAIIDNEKLKLKSIKAFGNRLSPEVFDNDNCMVYFNNINVYISNNTTFTDNYGSAICLDDASLYIEDNVEFYHNFGYRGGALNMKGESIIYPSDGSSALFAENNAVYGGAIYRGSIQKYNSDNNNTMACIFDFQNSQSNYTITFSDNLARLTGFSIFIVDLANNYYCVEQLENNTNVMFSSPSHLNVVTAATQITFTDPVYIDDNGNYVLDISLGIYLTLNTSIISETSFDSSALFYVTLLKDSYAYFGNVNHTKLNGPAAISLSQGTTLTNLFFTGNEINSSNTGENFSLIFNLAEDHSIQSVVNLNFKPCNLGFKYDSKQQKCVCVKSTHLLCNERQNLSCIERGFWYGTDNGVVIPCYSGFCKNSFDSCLPCELEGGGGQFCKLQNSEQEECTDNHNGLGCIYCVENTTYTLGAQRCINVDKCDLKKDVPVLLICCFLYLILIIAEIYFVLKIDNQKNFGYLYCIVYYYSVISFILPASLVNSKVSAADFIIQSFVTQNPLFLGQLDLCFELIRSPIYLIAINYTFPLAIIILVSLMILLSRSFPRYIQFKNNAGVRGTCVVILFSYTAFLATSFNIINPVRYSVTGDGDDKVYVSSDPKQEYLNTDDPWYILLWIVAMLFMIMFILPLTFFLLFSPLIMRRFNLIKIKPFLDQFHACYKDEYRWMCGFYFLNRLIYFAIIIDPTTTEVNSYPYIRYLSVAVAIIHCLIQPYKNKSLNIADAVILSNIASLSLIHNIKDIKFFGFDVKTMNTIRLTVTYILLYIPALYLLILLIIFSFQKSSKLRKAKMKLEHCCCVFLSKTKHSRRHRLIESDSMEDSLNLDFEFNRKQVNDTRESLLSYIEDNEVTNAEKKPVSQVQTKKIPLQPRLATKPNFSELIGSGVMSPGERKGSFLVQYVKYKQNPEDSASGSSEMAEVTGNN